jgi:hypothetical protein
MKQPKLESIENIKLGEFYRSFPDIASAKEVVAIKRFRGIDGYYVPAELFEELLKLASKDDA